MLVDEHRATVAQIVARMRTVHAGSEAVSLRDGQVTCITYPGLDESLAAGLCHTSGTTGDPKGVRNSHRSQVTHALAACMTDTFAVGAADRILPVVSVYHGTAWGLP